MAIYSESLLIFTLFAVLWLENNAHCGGFTHEKTHKKFGDKKTSTATIKSTPISNKFGSKCNTGTVPTCQCDSDNDSLYYPVPKSGNCTDVFKRLPTTSDYHFREENCHKAQRTVCWTDSSCLDYVINQDNQPVQPPDEFILIRNASKPFCMCDFIEKRPMPKSGNCAELNNQFSCYKMQTLCRDICNCDNNYVDPTKCDPQTCNNATEPFCMCGIDGDHYPVPESGNCMDVISTTPAYNDRFGFSCCKARTVCKCMILPPRCNCDHECESGCG